MECYLYQKWLGACNCTYDALRSHHVSCFKCEAGKFKILIIECSGRVNDVRWWRELNLLPLRPSLPNVIVESKLQSIQYSHGISFSWRIAHRWWWFLRTRHTHAVAVCVSNWVSANDVIFQQNCARYLLSRYLSLYYYFINVFILIV